MNRVEITGRLTKDPEVRYSAGDNVIAIANFSVAVNRRFTEGTDFINCKAFGKTAEFVEKYFKKGMKIEVCGRIETGFYEKNDGTRVNTTAVIAEDVDFGESKAARSDSSAKDDAFEGFANIPDGVDEMLPFAAPTR